MLCEPLFVHTAFHTSSKAISSFLAGLLKRCVLLVHTLKIQEQYLYITLHGRCPHIILRK